VNKTPTLVHLLGDPLSLSHVQHLLQPLQFKSNTIAIGWPHYSRLLIGYDHDHAIYAGHHNIAVELIVLHVFPWQHCSPNSKQIAVIAYLSTMTYLLLLSNYRGTMKRIYVKSSREYETSNRHDAVFSWHTRQLQTWNTALHKTRIVYHRQFAFFFSATGIRRFKNARSLLISQYSLRGKIKLTPCLTKHHAILGRGRIALRILNVGTRWRWVVVFMYRQL
jgi:hypothetical protein